MKLYTIKSEGLAHNSYLLLAGSEGAVIDPRRDCRVYKHLASKNCAKIKYIFETHRNEDYAIGSLELAYSTGARIYHGPGLEFKYGETLMDGQEFNIGELRLKSIHTPSHTDESMCYAITDLGAGKDVALVFTGDTLFAGDVGRTDPYGPKEAPRLAETLYNSIFNRILPLGDGVIACPAHGAGSVCGGAIAEREETTLGLERRQNPAPQKTKEDFVSFKIGEYHERPPYFRKMEEYNLNGPPLLKGLPNPKPLQPKEFTEEISCGGVVVDTRSPPAFGGAYIESSYNIWLEGLPAYAGWVLPYEKPILLVLEYKKDLDKAVPYLIRLGYDAITGYLSGGIDARYNEALPIEHMGLWTAHDLKEKLNGNITVLDVRGGDEWRDGHISGALNIHVGPLEEHIKEIPSDRPVATLCKVGLRASLAASILRWTGFKEVYTVLGSMTAWKNAGYPTVT